MKEARIQNALYIFIAIGALFGVLFLRPVRQAEVARDESDQVSNHIPYIAAKDTTIPVTIADTVLLREQGLSGTSRLQQGTGKLFIFDTPDRYGFWMKDMAYALDIVWVDADWRVVGIAQALQPESYPEVFYPPTAVSYVLEVNADESAGDNLTVGTELTFEK